MQCDNCHKFIEHDKFLKRSTVKGCTAINPFFKLTRRILQRGNIDLAAKSTEFAVNIFPLILNIFAVIF